MKLLNILNTLLLEDASKTKPGDVTIEVTFTEHQSVDRQGVISYNEILQKAKLNKDKVERIEIRPGIYDTRKLLPSKAGVPNNKLKEIILDNEEEFARQYLRFTVGRDKITPKDRYIKFYCVYYDKNLELFLDFIVRFVAKNHERTDIVAEIITSAFSYSGTYFDHRRTFEGADVYYLINRNETMNNYTRFKFPNQINPKTTIKIASS